MVLKNSRLKAAQKRLEREQLIALLIESPVDLYYLTGAHLSLGKLTLTKSAAHLFVDARYFDACKGLSGVKTHLTKGFGKDSLFAKEFAKLEGKRIGFDSAYTPFESWALYSKWVTRKSLVPVKRPLSPLRSVKEASEIQKLKRAAKLNVRGMQFLKKRLKVGVSEKELATALELFWLKEGGGPMSFEPIIAFGENSALAHHRASSRRLKRGDTALFDIGINVEGYVSDMTRTYFYGEPPKKMREIYAVVEKAQKRALLAASAGVQTGELDKLARSVIEEAGFGPLFGHSLGHGIGLEIHEEPSLRSSSETLLEPGMVVTIEPGIYLPGVGGVRIEDSVLIKEKGIEILTI